VGLFEGSLGVPSGAAWSWIALHVVLITVAVAALAAAITRIGAAQASIGLALEPAIAVVGAALILRESPGPSQVVGSVLLVGAVALLPFADSNPGSEHASGMGLEAPDRALGYLVSGSQILPQRDDG
jgi:drug/metabolite transporter (DMT)-like permease